MHILLPLWGPIRPSKAALALDETASVSLFMQNLAPPPFFLALKLDFWMSLCAAFLPRDPENKDIYLLPAHHIKGGSKEVLVFFLICKWMKCFMCMGGSR